MESITLELCDFKGLNRKYLGSPMQVTVKTQQVEITTNYIRNLCIIIPILHRKDRYKFFSV